MLWSVFLGNYFHISSVLAFVVNRKGNTPAFAPGNSLMESTPGSWSSLFVDEGCLVPSGKLLCIWQTTKKLCSTSIATFHTCLNVWSGWSSSSSRELHAWGYVVQQYFFAAKKCVSLPAPSLEWLILLSTSRFVMTQLVSWQVTLDLLPAVIFE